MGLRDQSALIALVQELVPRGCRGFERSGEQVREPSLLIRARAVDGTEIARELRHVIRVNLRSLQLVNGALRINVMRGTDHESGRPQLAVQPFEAVSERLRHRLAPCSSRA
jgi:hypothetical protein